MNLAFGRCRDINGPLMEAALVLYRSSFPAHELRLPPDQRDVMGDPLYHFDMCLLDGALAGLILYWDFGTYIYVEHFCIVPDMRGGGLGKRALELLGRSGKTVILEIDPPEDSVSERRRDFYLRAGYRMNSIEHIHPPYRKEYDGHRLKVMSFPRELSETEYENFASFLRNTVMKDLP